MSKQVKAFKAMLRATARVLYDDVDLVDGYAPVMRQHYGLDLATDPAAQRRITDVLAAHVDLAIAEKRHVRLAEAAQIAFLLVGCPAGLRAIRGRIALRALDGYSEHKLVGLWKAQLPKVSARVANRRIRDHEAARAAAAAAATADDPPAIRERGPAPDYASPPGATIADLIEERGGSAEEFAASIGLAADQFAALLIGQHHIDDELAAKLEAATGAPAEFWLAREANYRAAVGRLGQALPRGNSTGKSTMGLLMAVAALAGAYPEPDRADPGLLDEDDAHA